MCKEKKVQVEPKSPQKLVINICDIILLGWDCHRTWESILFGAIPIVLYSAPMADLYSRVPVMVVHSWKEVTEDKLLEFWVNTTSKEVLMVDYWLERIGQSRATWKANLYQGHIRHVHSFFSVPSIIEKNIRQDNVSIFWKDLIKVKSIARQPKTTLT